MRRICYHGEWYEDCVRLRHMPRFRSFLLPSLLTGLFTLPAACSSDLSDDDQLGGKADGFSSDQVVVNEIAAHPDFDVNGDGKVGTGDEYIEIVNAGSKPADFGGIELVDNNQTRFVFPEGSIIPAGGVAMVMANRGSFVAPDGAVVFSAGRLGLNDDSDSITLRVGDTVLEKHGYNMPTTERRAWNRFADADHESIFQLTDPSPGTRQDGSLFGTSILSPEQAGSVLAELDNECPDTFCGGDFSYFFVDGAGSLSCLGNGRCTMTAEIKPAVEDKFATDVLDGFDVNSLRADDPHGTFSGRLTGIATRDTFENDQDVFVKAECELAGSYFRASDIVDERGRPTDDFRENAIDCLSSQNGLDSDALPRLPTFRGLLTQFERANLLSALHEECPDTFCGGDFTYFFTKGDGALECENGGTCALDFAVTPFDDAWAADPTAGVPADELTHAAPSGLFDVTATGSKVRDGETFVTVRCDLFENTFNPEDIYDRDGDEATSDFRDMFLACIDAAESTVFARLPLQ